MSKPKTEVYRISEEELSNWLTRYYETGWSRGFWIGSAISLIGMLLIIIFNR